MTTNDVHNMLLGSPLHAVTNQAAPVLMLTAIIDWLAVYDFYYSTYRRSAMSLSFTSRLFPAVGDCTTFFFLIPKKRDIFAVYNYLKYEQEVNHFLLFILLPRWQDLHHGCQIVGNHQKVRLPFRQATFLSPKKPSEPWRNHGYIQSYLLSLWGFELRWILLSMRRQSINRQTNSTKSPYTIRMRSNI